MDKKRISLTVYMFLALCLTAHAQIKHRFLLADEGGNQILHVDENNPDAFWRAGARGNRDLQLIGDGLVLLNKHGSGYREMDIATGSIEKDVDLDIGKTTSARRLPNGHTVLAGDNLDGERGITLVEVDTNDQIVRKASFAGLSTLRVMRMTAEGTFLVGTSSKIVEVNWDGDIVWENELQINGYGAYMGLRLLTGNTMVACGYTPVMHEYSPDGQLVRDMGGNDQPGADSINPNFYGGFQILDNGNVVVTNWQGHGGGHGNDGVQLLEYDTAGNLVWTWQDPEDPPRFSSLHHALILDGLDTELMYDDVHGFMHPVFGCTGESAANYDSLALEDDGSCQTTAIDIVKSRDAAHHGSLTVSIGDPGPHSLEVLDLKGRKLFRTAGTGPAHYPLSDIPERGIYLIMVTTPSAEVLRKAVVIQH